MRSLMAMARGRQKDEWQRTSWILAMIRNSNAAKRSDCIRPEQVNPFEMRNNRRDTSELAQARRELGEALERRENARRK